MGKRIQRVEIDKMNTKLLELGYVGENEHTEVQIDCSGVLWDYPEATAEMTVQAPNGEKYPVVPELKDNVVVWDVTDSDLVYAGSGKIQITLKNGTEVIKSASCGTRIMESITATGPAPTPLENWMNQAEETAHQIALTAKDEVIEQIQDAAEEARESIPEDYSTLSEDVTGLKSALNDISTDGIIHLDKSFTWLNAWVNAFGKIQASGASKTALVTLQAGETITVGTTNTNLCIIGSTENDAIAINDVVTVIQTTSNINRFETHSYTATDTINIVFCVNYSDYTLDFTKSTNLAKLFESVGDVDDLETDNKSNLVIAINEINTKAESVSKYIVHDPESNYINKTDFTNGYINASGDFVANNDWRATDYCELMPNTQYYGHGLYGGYCAFYRADKSVINAYGVNAFDISSFVTPNETAFARFSLNTLSPTQGIDIAWINIKNEKPSDYGYAFDGISVIDTDENPCDYDGHEISVFNKILCVGDSMTQGTFNHLDSGSTQWVSYSKYSYPTYLHKMTGVDVTNLGHGGQTSVQWYNTEQGNDLSGYDCAIIQLGINDFGTYGELGTDTKTAFQNIITKLKTENENIKIFVANIIPATSYSSDGYKAFSTALLEWLETTYASDPNVIPVDIQQYGHTGNSSAFNAGHLTALGYRMLAQDYIGFISSYIKNNGSVFREVQFIGTDYWYVNPNN